MNIDEQCWSYKNLSEIFDKESLLKIVSNYMSKFEIYRVLSMNYIKVHPLEIGNIIHFNKEKSATLHGHSILSNNIMKFVITSVFVVMLLSMLGMSFNDAKKPTRNYVTIPVSSGDTVWTIAARYASDKEDLRELVYEITTINGLNHNALIYSGQTLKVPMHNTVSMELATNRPQ